MRFECIRREGNSNRPRGLLRDVGGKSEVMFGRQFRDLRRGAALFNVLYNRRDEDEHISEVMIVVVVNGEA